MDKLKVLSGKDVCKILAKHGFIQVRQKGSHIIMQKREGNTTTTVPVPITQKLKRNTSIDYSPIRNSEAIF